MNQSVKLDLEACFNNPEIYAEMVKILQQLENKTKESAEAELNEAMIKMGFNVKEKETL